MNITLSPLAYAAILASLRDNERACDLLDVPADRYRQAREELQRGMRQEVTSAFLQYTPALLRRQI